MSQIIDLLFLAIPIATVGYLIPLIAKAQITTDGTTSTVSGNSLFHSLNRFIDIDKFSALHSCGMILHLGNYRSFQSSRRH